MFVIEIPVVIPESFLKRSLRYPKIKLMIFVCLAMDISSINNIWCQALILEGEIFSNSAVATILSNIWIEQVFVMSRYNWWYVVHTAIAYFYRFRFKDLMEFICFRKVLFYQAKEGLTNICFDISGIRWIIPHYFALSFFITILTFLFCADA